MTHPPHTSGPALLAFVATLAALTMAAAAGLWLILGRLGPTHSGSEALLAIVALAYIAAIASSAFRLIWNPTLAPYPPRESDPDAVRRRFQSFGLVIVNMGLSIHVAADAHHLHLTPLLVWRWLGARGASIPWSAMTPHGSSGRVVRLGGPSGWKLDGPAWCMKLVHPTGASG